MLSTKPQPGSGLSRYFPPKHKIYSAFPCKNVWNHYPRDPKCILLLYLHRRREREREKAIQSNSHKVQVLPPKFLIPLVNVSNTPKALVGTLQTNPTCQSTQGQSKQGPSIDLDEEIVTDFSGALGLVPGKNQIGLSEAKKMGRAPEFPGDWHHSCWSMLILVIDVFMYMKIQNTGNVFSN